MSLVGFNQGIISNSGPGRIHNPRTVEESAWFDGSADGQEFIFRNTGNNTKWTFSTWVMITDLTSSQNGYVWDASTGSGSTTQTGLQIENNSVNFFEYQSGTIGRAPCDGLFRDNTWYHIVAVFDSTNATGSDRMRLYINGVRQVSGTTRTAVTISQNTTSTMNTAGRICSVAHQTYSSDLHFFDGYIAQHTFIDGQALEPESFGEYRYVGQNGQIWIPKTDAEVKKLATQAGGNSFCLTKNIGDGKDSSYVGLVDTPTGIDIGGSVWFDGTADYFDTQLSAFTNKKEAVFSFWIKRTEFGNQQAVFGSVDATPKGFILQFNSSDQFWIYENELDRRITTRTFKDTDWHHFVISFDTSQAVENDRIRLWVDGEEITDFGTISNPVQDADILGLSGGNDTAARRFRIGNYNNTVDNFYFSNIYLAQTSMLEGQSIQQDYTINDFGQYIAIQTDNGQITRWLPKSDSDIITLVNAAGGNSFVLDFSDSGNIGRDRGNQNNNFVPISMTLDNHSEGNPISLYPTIDVNATRVATTTNGALTFSVGTALDVGPSSIAMPPNSGKWYAEISIDTVGNAMVGVVDGSWKTDTSTLRHPGDEAQGFVSIGYWYANGNKFVNATIGSSGTSYGSSYTTGDIIGIAIDTDNGTVNFYKNGVDQGPISYDNTRAVKFACGTGGTAASTNLQTFNFEATLAGHQNLVGVYEPKRPLSFGPISMSHAANGSENTPARTYPIWNTLQPASGITGSVTFTSGNIGLNVSNGQARSTVAFGPAGKYYWEFPTPAPGTSADVRLGFVKVEDDFNTSYFPNSVLYEDDGRIYVDGSLITTVAGYTISNTIAVKVDLDNDIAEFLLDGVSVWSGDISAVLDESRIFQIMGAASNSVNLSGITIRTQDSDLTLPIGYKTVNSVNLTAPKYQGLDWFNAVTYPGDGVGQDVTGVGFQPSLVWAKNRTFVTGQSHILVDNVRGATKVLKSNTNGAEAIDSNSITAFLEDGFTVGSSLEPNKSGDGYVAWCWRTDIPVTVNTEGSISSNVASTSTGHFSIVTWTDVASNQSIGHGLESPDLIITKSRDNATSWYTWTNDIGMTLSSGNYLILDGSGALGTDGVSAGVHQGAGSLGATTFLTGNNGSIWPGDCVAYVFKSVPGVCKVGSYTGNGSTDGPYVYLGFKPRWVMIKASSSPGGRWNIYDTAREPTNDASWSVLDASSSDDEATLGSSDDLDILADGFKLRRNGSNFNSSGVTYIYLAMADVAGNGYLPPVPGR